MTNFVNDDVMNAALAEISGNATTLYICSGDPTTRAAVLTNALASIAVTAPDFTQADGDVSGRKHTIGAQSIPSASASGLAAVMAIIDGTRLLFKADLSATQTITSGNPVNTNASDHEIRDPA